MHGAVCLCGEWVQPLTRRLRVEHRGGKMAAHRGLLQRLTPLFHMMSLKYCVWLHAKQRQHRVTLQSHERLEVCATGKRVQVQC